jgi:hypothetical protein
MPSKLTVLLVSLLLATPLVIFWLWLVIVPARVALLCPEKCWCNTDGYIVVCYYPSVTTVPLIRFTEVRALWFYENDITLFERDSFVSLTELDILRVDQCGLRTIEVGAFNGLTKLTKLYIVGNEISEIIPGTFENMISLEHLDLSNNRLERLDIDVFSGLVNIFRIDVENNKLQYVHPDTFLGLPNIQHVYLYNNSILQIPTDRPFINSLSLSQLYISNCNISSVSVETFANVISLEWLSLSLNNLRTVDINILRALPKLSTIYLEGNPLQCDCQLQEVWRWCEKRNIQAGYRGKEPKCDTPSEVEGMWWGVLEEGQCLQGTIQYSEDYDITGYSYTNTDDTSNDTQSQQNGFVPSFLAQYQAPIFAFPFIFGVTGNVIILIIFTRNKDMRTLPNMYILNLAISDIIYLTVHFSEACANVISDTWLKGAFLCRFLPFCQRLSVGLSSYSVAVLSIQRYRVTVKPFQVGLSSQQTWCGTVTTICGVWIVAALFAVPSAVSQYLCEEIFVLGTIPYYTRVVVFEFLVSCVFPLCIIAFTYIMTARHFVERYCPQFDWTQNPLLKARKITAKIVVGLTVVFLVSYVPYHVFWTYIICTEEKYKIYERITDIILKSNFKFQYTYLISRGFLLINSCLNPVALFCTSSTFRKHLKRYLTYFCKTNSPPNDMVLTRR